MKSIDNAFHAVTDAQSEGLDLSHLVVTAWSTAQVTKLDRALVRGLGKPDGLSVDDVITTATVGTVIDIVGERGKDSRQMIEGPDLRECEDEYIELIRKASDTSDPNFLERRRKFIRAAIDMSVRARLDGVGLEDKFYPTVKPVGMALSFATEVADYYRDYKQQSNLLDAADLLMSELVPIEHCELCFLDRVGIPPLGLAALRRLLPSAFFCTVYADSR